MLRFSIWLTEVQQVLGPQLYSAMSNQTEVAKKVCVGDGGQQPFRGNPGRQRTRHPQPYCLVVPEELLR